MKWGRGHVVILMYPPHSPHWGPIQQGLCSTLRFVPLRGSGTPKRGMNQNGYRTPAISGIRTRGINQVGI